MTPNILRMTFLSALSLVVALSVPVGANGTEEPREGGLTGTGIVGEITALGSIIVNGQRITFADDLPVENAVAAKTAADLTPGDVVAVAVAAQGAGWVADGISELHPVIGPVSEVRAGGFTVLGVAVDWADAVSVPAAGDWVAVSGFWSRDGVVATQVTAVTPQEKVSIQGSYRLSSDEGRAMVGTVDLALEPLRHAQEGDVIRVSGVVNDGTLAVTDVDLGLFDRPVSLVLAEGYLSNVAPSGHYTVAGSGLSSYTDNQQSIMVPNRVTVCGVDGRLAVDAPLTSELARRLGCNDLR